MANQSVAKSSISDQNYLMEWQMTDGSHSEF